MNENDDAFAKRKHGEKLCAQGINYRKQGRYDKATEMLEAALTIAREIGDRNGEGMSLGCLGNVYDDLEQFDKAAENYKAALEIAREIGDRRGESMSLGCLGNVYNGLEQFDKAAENYKAALEIAREIGDREGEGKWLGSLGYVCISLQQYDKVAEKFETALAIAREIGDREGEGKWLGILGNVYKNLGQYNKATEKLEAALEIAREIGDREGEGRTLGSLGKIYFDLAQYDKAAEKFEAASEIVRETGDRSGEGPMLVGLGDVYISLGQYAKAAEKFKVALEIAQEIGNRYAEGTVLGGLGNVYGHLGQYDKAAEKFEAAMEIAQEIGDSEGECRGLVGLGNVYRDLGQYDKAAEKLEAGLEIARETGDRHVQGTVIGNLGTIYMHLGQYDKAVEKFEIALEIDQEIGDRRGKYMSLGNLGFVYIKLGQYDKAAEKFEAVLEIARETGNRYAEGTGLDGLGEVYDDLGQYDKAAESYEAGLEIVREIGDRNGEGMMLANLGNVYKNLRQYHKAAEKYEAALEIVREIGNRNAEGTVIGNLGTVFKNLGQYDKAAEKLEAALEIAQEIGDRRGESRTLGSLGHVYMDLRQYDKAAEKLEAALEIAQEIGDRNAEGVCLGSLGSCHYVQSSTQQNHDKAVEYLKKSIRVFDDLWMDIKEDNQKVTYDDVNGSSSIGSKCLYSLYWNTGHFEDALLTREQASSKSLEVMLLESRMDKANDEYSHSSKQKKSVINFEQMRHIAIQSKSAIVVYDLHVDGDILIWVIKSKDGEDISLAHEKVPINKKYKSLQYLVEATRRSLGARDRKHLTKRRIKDRELHSLAMPLVGEDDKHINDFNDLDVQAVENELRKAGHGSIDGPNITMENALRQLYKLLILPIEDALVNEQRLTIIPFGDLFALPFASLVDENDQHLIEKYILSFAPSIGTLVELKHNRDISKDTKGSTVIVGTGANLSGAREEAEKVHKIVTTSNGQEREVKKFVGKEATKDVVVDAMQSADIIHLATHGSKDGISLSGLTGKDVKLTMGEVQSLDLKGTKMVVLSACDTFKGDLRTDGVVGITRSFLAAGSSTVIASLWPVNDYSTKEMMVRLYEFMFQQNGSDANDHGDGDGGDDTVDVSYALQQVMIGMLKEEGGSFDIKQWAPFLVYGLNTSLGN